jgi:hypothetical protein
MAGIERIESAARRLWKSLSNGQQNVAQVATQVPQVGSDGSANSHGLQGPDVAKASPIQKGKGLRFDAMSTTSQDLLMVVLERLCEMMAPQIAEERMEAVELSGVDDITLLWMGDQNADGGSHYYRIQGSTFLLEVGAPRSQKQHIHAGWRDFNGDYGQELLLEHMAAEGIFLDETDRKRMARNELPLHQIHSFGNVPSATGGLPVSVGPTRVIRALSKDGNCPTPLPTPTSAPIPPTPATTPAPTPVVAIPSFDWDEFDWNKLANAECTSTHSGKRHAGTFGSHFNCQPVCKRGCYGYEYNKQLDTCTLFSTTITGT